MALSSNYRKADAVGTKGDPAAPEETGLLKAFSALQGFLRETAWEDGATRETATLMIFAEDGRWKAMLNDRDAGHVCFVSGDDLKAVLGSLEKGLVAGNLDWRVSNRTQGKAKKG